MEITTKELRIQPGKIIDQVAHGQEMTVTYRGRALARIVPIDKKVKGKEEAGNSIFGMWNARSREEPVETLVRGIRKGRRF
jgi:prevent-host-death family protein